MEVVNMGEIDQFIIAVYSLFLYSYCQVKFFETWIRQMSFINIYTVLFYKIFRVHICKKSNGSFFAEISQEVEK